MRKNFLLFALLNALFSTASYATIYLWYGGAASGSYVTNDWTNPANWRNPAPGYPFSYGSTPAVAPTYSDNVLIPSSPGYGSGQFPILNTDGYCAEIYFGDPSGGIGTTGVSMPHMLTLDGGATLHTQGSYFVNNMTNANVITYTNSLENTVESQYFKEIGNFIFQNLTILSGGGNLNGGTVTVNNKLRILQGSTFDVSCGSCNLIINSKSEPYNNTGSNSLTFENGSIFLYDPVASALGTLTGNVHMRVHAIRQKATTAAYRSNNGRRSHFISSPVNDPQFYTQLDGTTYSPFNTKPIYMDIESLETYYGAGDGHPMYNPSYAYPLSITHTNAGHGAATLPCDPMMPVSDPWWDDYTDYLAYFDECANYRITVTPVFRWYDETLGGNASDITENYGYVGLNYDPANPSHGQMLGPLDGVYTHFQPSANGYDDDGNADTLYNYIEYYGAVNSGPVSQNVNYTNYGNAWDGYQILGNPFPAPLSWDDAYAANSSYLDGVIRVWDGVTRGINSGLSSANNGHWLYYDAKGVVPNDFNGHIAIGQAFIAQATASGTVTFNDDKCVVDDNTVGLYRKLPPADMISLGVSGPDNTDNLHIRVGKDAAKPVVKSMENQATVLYAYADKTCWHFKTVAEPTESVRLALGLRTGQTGDYTITTVGLTYDDVGYHAYLVDEKEHQHMRITKNMTYSVHLTAGDWKNRFYMELARTGSERDASLTQARMNCHAGEGSLTLFVSDPQIEGGTVTVSDMMGRIVLTQQTRFRNGQAILPSTILNTGGYTITLLSEKGTLKSRLTILD